MWSVIRPIAFQLPAETAHDLAKTGMQYAQRSDGVRDFVRGQYGYHHPSLQVDAFGLSFPNPVGIAPGFDKNGEVSAFLADLGFGTVTAGTVTPRAQLGNPRPRMFRLVEDRAMINRLSLPNNGADAVARTLAQMPPFEAPLGVAIEKMNTSDATTGIADTRSVFERLSPYADYAIVTFCPNTPDNYDRTLGEDGIEYMSRIFEAVQGANDEDIPILVRVGRDPDRESLDRIVDVVERHELDGFITNTPKTPDSETTSRLNSPNRFEEGNLTGRPIESLSERIVRELYRRTNLPIIGVGGIDSAETAYSRIRAGATMVMLYTGFIYRGPSIARDISRGLVRYLEQDGFDSITEAVGADID